MTEWYWGKPYDRPGSAAELRASCADPNTPSEVLTELLCYPWERAIDRQAIASNPATSLNDLLGLTMEYADCVLKNPAFRLHLTAEPDLLLCASTCEQVAILRSHSVDESIIRQLATSRRMPVDVRAAAAANPRCPVDLMRAYLKHARAVRTALATNPRLPSHIAEDLTRIETERVRQRTESPPVGPPQRPRDRHRLSRRWRARIAQSQTAASLLKV